MAILIVPWAIFSLLTVLAAGVISWRQGYRSTRFFMLAWLGMIVSIIWIFLVRMGILPSTFFSENAYRIGILWMAICWSLALADRINLLKAETENANRSLTESEHRLSQILEGLPLGVVLYGKDQKPKYANRRTLDILSDPARGIQPDINAGRTLQEAIPYFSLKAASSQQEYDIERFPVFNALHGQPSSVDDVEMERGGERVALEIQASPVLDNAGNVESAVVAVQDITERKRAEADLEEYRQHLERLVEKRTEELSVINAQLTVEASERQMLALTLEHRIEWLSAVNRAHQTMAGVAGLTAAYRALSATICDCWRQGWSSLYAGTGRESCVRSSVLRNRLMKTLRRKSCRLPSARILRCAGTSSWVRRLPGRLARAKIYLKPCRCASRNMVSGRRSWRQ